MTKGCVPGVGADIFRPRGGRFVNRPYDIHRTSRRGDLWSPAFHSVIALRRCDFVFQNHRADNIRPYDIYRPSP